MFYKYFTQLFFTSILVSCYATNKQCGISKKLDDTFRFHSNWNFIRSADGNDNENDVNTNQRIIGGTKATAEQFPWQAMLSFQGFLRCGATLISDSWAVTAAHCLHDYSPRTKSSFKLKLAKLRMKIEDKYEITKSVKRVVKHPMYSSLTMNADVALIELETSVLKNSNYTRGILPICLDEPDYWFKYNSLFETCVVSGWGTTKYSRRGKPSDDLMYAELDLISEPRCAFLYRYYKNAGNFCAGILRGGVGTCFGDSGGPLACKNRNDRNAKWRVVGIVSFGYGCALAYLPSCYMRISFYASWIKAITGIM